MFSNLLLSAAAVLLVGTGAAFAETKAPSGDGKAPHEKFMSEIDTDKDGSVSAAKSDAQAAKKFEEFDANKDGSVSLDEMDKHHEAEKAKREAARAEREAEMKKKYQSKVDPDGDGKITKEEFLKNAKERHAKMDANGDGKVTKDEMKKGHGKRGPKGDGPKPDDAPPAE